MNTKRATAWMVGLLGLVLVGCNSGGGSSSTVAGVGLEMPTEISAVPASGGGSSKLTVALMALGAAADPGTDYSNAQTVRFVNEPTLEQFEIIEEILAAIAQTHYADSENIGAGPYKVMVSFQDEQNGIETKSLEPWIVQTDLITENGQTVNRLRAWIEENMDGMVRTIKAEVKIYEAATRNADGSYADYGVWTINAKFDEAGNNFFAAEASRGSNGETVLALHERMQEGPSFTHQVKAYLNKSDTSGYGRVDYPDWSSCTQPDCSPGMTSAAYAYNGTHLAVQEQGETNPTFKNRTAVTAMTHRYGLFDSVTGGDVLKTKSFGFPVRFTDDTGTHYGYYGAWQGRHQLWSDVGSVPDDTVVTRQDRGPDQTAETYTTVSFVGTLTKRTLVAADIDDILNIPVETWVNQNFQLMGDGSQWIDCKSPIDFNQTPPACGGGSGPFTDFNSLINDPANRRKFININRWDNNNNVNVEYVYDPNGSPAGFYVATRDPQSGNLVVASPATLLPPNSGNQVWVNIGGSIYIEYTGTGATGWVEKTLANFDERTWTPEFDPSGNVDYTLPLDREYYINNQGANYVVKKTADGPPAVYDVQIELQTVANPTNVASFLTQGVTTTFNPQWDDQGNSTYRLVTDSADPNFLKLVYVAVGSNDSALTDELGNPVDVGDVVTQGVWGLVAYEDGVATTQQFNWEYPRPGENWGTLTYLLDASNNYKLLDDPIALAPVTLTNGAGVQKTLSLRYDGWMHGMPDLFEDLRKNDFVVTQAIADKIITIPTGTQLDDAADSSKHYLVKPLEVSEFLAVVADPADAALTAALATADAVNLDGLVPSFVEHGMGATPNVTTIKYSEGNLVE